MMSRQKIEEKDYELIQKFRSVVHLKEQQNRETRKRVIAVGLAACCVLLVSLAAYLGFTRSPAGDAAVDISDLEVAAETSPDPKFPVQSAGTVAAETKTPQEPPPTVPIETVGSGSVKTVQSGAAAMEAGSEPARSAKGIRIAQIVACKGVADRDCVSSQTTFSLENGEAPDVWVWMDVRSDSRRLPYVLEHVYYVNGSRYASVALEIKYPRMRTWSNVTLKSPDLVGRWEVAVVTGEGHTLSRIAFEVVP